MKKIKNYLLHNILITFTLFSLISCNKADSQKTSLSFYYWKTIFELDEYELEKLVESETQKIYIRFFDIDWNPADKKATPVAVIQFKQKKIPVQEIIPTVFITNRTMLNIPEKEIDLLAKNIYEKISFILADALQNQFDIKEIQLDCDWSQDSKERFFKLIRKVKEYGASNNVLISATIRLHQIKYYTTTGVPPADKGMLMFYNMGKLDGSNTNNSILDLKIAEKYIENIAIYPLKLDIALPIYSWGVLKRRGKITALLNNSTENTFSNVERYKKNQEKQFEVIKSHYLNGIYLYKKDLIRIEDVTIETLEQTAALLSKHIKNDSLTLTFYHLDTKNLKKYDYERIKNLRTFFDD